MGNPVVSVILRTRDRPQYLKKALESVKSQALDNIEVVVVDAGKRECPRPLRDGFLRHIIYVRKAQATNAGALNIGLNNCKSPYVAILDDDDWWDKDFLSVLYKCISSSDCDIVFCRGCYARGGAIVGETPKFTGKDLLAEMLDQNLMLSNTVLVKRNLLHKAGGFDEGLSAAVDWDMWLRVLMLRPRWKAVDRLLSYAGVHRDNISLNKAEAVRNEIKVLTKLRDRIIPRYRAVVLNSIARKHIYLGACLITQNNKAEGRKQILTGLRNAGLSRVVYGLGLCGLSFIASPVLIAGILRFFYRVSGKAKRRVFF